MGPAEAELLALRGNTALVKLSHRQFPGLLLQGDSLKILSEVVAELADAVRSVDGKLPYYS